MVRLDLLYVFLLIAQFSHPGIKDNNNVSDIIYIIDKNDCFLNIFYLFGL